MKVVYFFAASLDGFIADKDDGVGWLDKLNVDKDGTGLETFFGQVEGLLMGRKTYDFVYNYGQWPYEGRPTWVCSHREIPAMDGCNLQNANSPAAAIEEARQQGISMLWVVGGGSLISSLIEKELLTHISVSVMPVLLGTGVPMVPELPQHLHMRQVGSKSESGYTQVEYSLEQAFA